MSEASDNQLALALVENGSEIAGAVIGGAAGLIGGPIGVTLGAGGGVLASNVFKRVGSELQTATSRPPPRRAWAARGGRRAGDAAHRGSSYEAFAHTA